MVVNGSILADNAWTNNAWGMGALGVTSAFTALALVFVCARLYTRLILVKSAGLEDLFISLAWVFSLILTVTTILRRSFYAD